MLHRLIPVLIIALCIANPVYAAGDKSSGWLGWSKDIFKRAKAENKFVLLDLEAVWCHWCHVMEKTTYADPEVKKLIAEKYLPVRVDQDANPDLSNRYGDWGWPATIVFAPDGSEIVKIRGYIPPVRMISLLQAIIKDPSPGPSVLAETEVLPAATSFLSEAQKKKIIETYSEVYDAENGGWGSAQKFIHTDSMDHALAQAAKGDKKYEKIARQTLDASLNLIDPVWGGVYQYSDQPNWRSPHFEKIMWYQVQYMRHYTQAYALWKTPAYLKATKDIHKYLTTFLKSDDGTFFTSQDADVNRQVDGKQFYALDNEGRRKLGMPRIDSNIYARENGWAVTGILALYNVTGDKAILDDAVRAMNRITAIRKLAEGGYSHGAKDRGGPFLGDTLAIGQAGLELYAATGDRKWLLSAAEAGSFINKNFKHAQGGYITSATTAADDGVFAKPVRQIEENIQVARFFNMLNRYHGSKQYREHAEHTMRYLASSTITEMRRFLIGIVLADEELAIEPAHVTIVGHKDDARAQALHKASLALPFPYRRIDWWDKREGAMINPDVEYPELEEAAAFACANNICSLPIMSPAELKSQVERMMNQRIVQQ